MWGGDGRTTAGHLAVLAERAAAGPPDLILFADPQDKIRLYEHDGQLVLDLPLATEAVVPQRPQPGPPPMRKSP